MSSGIYEELTFFFHSCLAGMGITFLYDGVLIWRKLIAHNNFWISIEDFFFWVFCAIGSFCLLIEENNGTLRWFAILGAAIGMAAYKKSVSSFYINIMSTIFGFCLRWIQKITRCCVKPLYKGANVVFFALKRGLYREKKYKKCLKKKLTVFIKLLKITLCKHNNQRNS